MMLKKLKLVGFLTVALAVLAIATAFLIWAAPYERTEFLGLLGSIFGSALAVTSAILVFEYQDRRSVFKRRAHYRNLLKNLELSSKNALDELAEGNLDRLPIAIDIMSRDHARLSRFFERFEFDDLRFSDAGLWFLLLEPAELKELCSNITHASDYNECRQLAHQFEHWIEFSTQSRSEIGVR